MTRLSNTGEQLLKQALQLPEQERVELAATIMETVDGQVDVAVDEAWQHEIRKRRGEVVSGQVTTVSWSEVRRDLGLPDDAVEIL